MSKLKLITILGTRPEIIRLSEIIKLCDTTFNHLLVHTGQNWDYSLNGVFFNDLGIRKPDYYLNCVGENLGETMGNIIHSSYNLFLKEKPDAILILGDTNSALSALSAKRLKIPIFHMEAGNRCFDENVPEEINRKIIDHISDINLPYTEHARRYLIQEGLRKEYIFVTGSPLPEVLNHNFSTINSSSILKTLNLSPSKYILVSVHREENIADPKNFSSVMTALNSIASTYQLPIIFSTHPRTKQMIQATHFQFNDLIKNLTPLGYTDYNKLQSDSFCVLSDSGTLAEEASLLHFPAISLRTSTERPEAMDKGCMILGGINENSIINSINLARTLFTMQSPSIPSAYIDTNVSAKVVTLIQSYTSIINKYIWHKS